MLGKDPKQAHKDRDNDDNLGFIMQLKVYVSDYCRRSTLSGIHYFCEQNRTIYERLWWSATVMLSIVFCYMTICKQYRKWARMPVIISLAGMESSIWTVPFPAVTICPDIKANPAFFNYTEILYKKLNEDVLSDEEDRHFGYMSLICRPRDINYTTINSIDKLDSNILYNFYDDVTSTLKNNFWKVRFLGKKYEFQRLFTPIITDEGVCYTFNMLDRDDLFRDTVQHYNNFHTVEFNKSGWSLDDGYLSADAVYPFRTLTASILYPLEVWVTENATERDSACAEGNQGYKVLLHNPANMPQLKKYYFRIPMGQSILVAVKPTMIQASENIKTYSADKRKCFISTERKLHYFKLYTQQNCELECKSNYTLSACGCVDFYMPHDNSTKICGATKKNCIEQAELRYTQSYINSMLNLPKPELNTKPLGSKQTNKTGDCSCLPECTYIDYEITISSSEWNWKKKAKLERIDLSDGEGLNVSIMKIYFKVDRFIPSTRQTIYESSDFISNFGGLLSLFTGCTAISFAEIVYFLSLRIWSNMKIYGKNYWFGFPDRKTNE